MTTTFRISTTNGNFLNGREYASEAEAQEAIRAHYGRDVHIELCGDRWLVWTSEEDSIDDDGARAIASIS